MPQFATAKINVVFLHYLAIFIFLYTGRVNLRALDRGRSLKNSKYRNSMTMYNFFSGRVLDLECTNKKKSEIELFKHWNLKIFCKNLSMSFLRKLPTLFWLLSLSILYEFFWCASFFWAKKTSEHRIATDKWFLTKKTFMKRRKKC